MNPAGRAPDAAAQARRVLGLLADGSARPADELAWRLRIAPAALRTLLTGLQARGQLEVVRAGAHRYHRLAPGVAAAPLDAAVRAALRPRRDAARIAPLRAGRSCHGHLAGRPGVALMAALRRGGWLLVEAGQCRLTEPGAAALRALGVDAGVARPDRVTGRACIDWSERLPHLGGPLGGALCRSLLARGWLQPGPRPRMLRLTPPGRAGLRDRFGVRLDAA